MMYDVRGPNIPFGASIFVWQCFFCLWDAFSCGKWQPTVTTYDVRYENTNEVQHDVAERLISRAIRRVISVTAV